MTLQNGDLGDITQVDVNFGFQIASDRVNQKSLGGGTILDLGVYTIQASLWAFREAPLEVTGEGTVNQDGVDVAVKGQLKFKNGVANISTSALQELDNTLVVQGTKGVMKVPSFWCPPSVIDIDGTPKVWPLPEPRVKPNYTNSEGLRYEAEEVRRCIKAGLLESPDMSHEESLRIVRIQDKLRQIVGVKYDCDE